MQESRILSIFKSDAAAPAARAGADLLWDACHVGVVLRAVLLVAAVTAVVALFASEDLAGFLAFLAGLISATLSATLVWLWTTCSLRSWLARGAGAWQLALGVGLGGLAGCYGAWMHGWVNGTGLRHALAWAAAGMLMAGVLVMTRVARARARIPAATQARLGELQARIRPHFLFNTLNSAMALMRAEPDRAESLLEDLSDLFRQALNDSTAAVTLVQEIELARRYLSIEAVRFGSRLQLQWSLDPRADTALLPPLLLQPLLENAVRHGVEPSDQGALIQVSSERRGARVRLQISNTVPVGPGPQGHGLALANVRERLLLLHDVQASFEVRAQADRFVVSLEFPA